MDLRRRLLQLLALTALILLSACADNGDDVRRPASTSPTSTTTNAIVAQVSPTPPTQATEITSAKPTEAPFFRATAVAEESAVRAVSTDLRPTPQPTIAIESSFDRDGDGFYTFDDLEQAVNELFPTYEWPENYQITPVLMLKGFAQNPDDRWEEGYEFTLVGLYHVCAWDRAWLDAYREGNTALMEESLYQLQDVALENPVFTYIREPLGQMFERASLGDPTLIQQYVDNSCATYEFLTPEAGTPRATVGRRA